MFRSYSPNSFQNDVEYMEIDRWGSRKEKKIISNNLALREKLYAWDNCLIIHVYSQKLTANSLLQTLRINYFGC